MFHFHCLPLESLKSEKVPGKSVRLLMNKRYRLHLSGPEAWKASCALYDLAEGLRRMDQGQKGMFRDPLDVDRCLIVILEKKVVRVHVEARGLDRKLRALTRFDPRKEDPWESVRHPGPFYLQVRFQDLEDVAHILQTGGKDGGW